MSDIRWAIGKKVYRRYFLSFALGITCLVALLSLFAYSSTLSWSTGLLKSLNLKLLSQIAYSATYMDSMAKNVARILFLHDYVKASIFLEEPDSMALSGAIREMEAVRVPNAHIHSIAFYNARTDLFISSLTGEVTSSRDFSDPYIVDLVKGYPRSGLPPMTPIPRKGGGDRPNLYVFVFPIMSSSSVMDGAIVVSVSTTWLSDLIRSVQETQKRADSEKVFVLDSKGVIVNHEDQGEFLVDYSSKPPVKLALAQREPSGIIEYREAGRRFFLFYVNDPGLNWKFVAITSYDAVFSALGRIQLVTIGSCLAAILLGLAYSLIISRRLYQPISSLAGSIGALLKAPATADAGEDEFQFLAKAFREVALQNEELEAAQSKDSAFQRNEFFKDLILGEGNAEAPPVALAGFEGTLDLEAELAMVLCSIADYGQVMRNIKESDRSVVKTVLSTTILERLRTNWSCEAVDLGSDTLAVLVDPAGRRDEIGPILRSVQETCRDQLSLVLSVSLTRPAKAGSGLAGLYRDALELHKYRYIHGKGCFIPAEILDGIVREPFVMPALKETLLLNSLKMGNRAQAGEIYGRIVTEVTNYSYETIGSCLTHLAYVIYGFTLRLAQNHVLGLTGIASELYERIVHAEYLEEVNAAFEAAFRGITARLSELNSSKREVLIGAVVAKIEEGYPDKGLCLSRIALDLDISDAYLGKLFKETMGKSVAEYLNTLRMEKFKHFLDTSSLPTQEIAEKVGLELSSYLYTSFKRHFGFSLGTYKRIRLVEKIDRAFAKEST